jgi:hypothetical protein
MKNPKIEVLPIEQGATPDPNNINKHTQRGGGLLENSIRKRGAFRSIASAGKGVETPVTYAGSHTLEKAVAAGFKRIINIHTTGEDLVNVVRDDIAPGSAEAIALGIEDNEIAKQSYNPDTDLLSEIIRTDNGVLAELKRQDKIFDGMMGGIVGGAVGYSRPDFDSIIEKFDEAEGKTGLSKKNGNWFYVEFYGQDELFNELKEILKDGLNLSINSIQNILRAW